MDKDWKDVLDKHPGKYLTGKMVKEFAHIKKSKSQALANKKKEVAGKMEGWSSTRKVFGNSNKKFYKAIDKLAANSRKSQKGKVTAEYSK